MSESTPDRRTRFQQAVGRFSGLMLEVMPGVNDQNMEEIFTLVVNQVAGEFPDVDIAEVANVIDRLSLYACFDTVN